MRWAVITRVRRLPRAANGGRRARIKEAMSYNRPWKSYAEQLDLLKSRGLQVTDEQVALRCLERIGYYRLSAYWYPFRVFRHVQNPGTRALTTVGTDEFVRDTHFSDAYDLYLFDKKLRLLVLDAMERIEIALRVDAAYELGRSGAFAHLDDAKLHPKFASKANAYLRWRKRYDELVSRSKEDFVKHYREKHGGDLPVWVAVEVLDFGAVSQLIGMMTVPDQQRIAGKYGVHWQVLRTWFRSLNYLRNLAAHHSRLWNRNVIDQPKLPAKGSVAWCDEFADKADLIAKPFLLLAITRHLLQALYPQSTWPERVARHLGEFPGQRSGRQLSVADMGAPAGWEQWWTAK